MSNYTMELREYIESWSPSDGSVNTRDMIETGRTKLFDFDYPIFDPNYKSVFETHFIRKFYTREIGFETEGLFKFQLETWLLINMPYFNKLFESELIEYNPLQNSETDVTHNNTKNNTSNSTIQSASHTSSNGSRNTTTTTGIDETTDITKTDFVRTLESNNPDSRLSITPNSDGSGVIEYASQINENTESGSNNKTYHSSGNNTSSDSANGTTDGSNNQSSNGTINETEDYIQHRVGKIGVQTYAKMIQEHRQAFLRIENQIFNEMQELFMLLY